jgi:CO/xanthine dehydrogenase FAD-binding subunit
VKPAPFALDTPTSVPETLELLSAHGADAKVLAGGQSLVPLLNFRLVRPTRLIDINRLSQLAYVNRSNGRLAIGALTRQRELEESSLVASEVPLLAEATRFVAHPAIRNRGTIGGSLAHNDPAAEYPLALLCLDAEVRVASVRGERTIAVRDLLLPWLSTTLEADELLLEVRVPVRDPRQGFGFQEVARRHGDFALVAVAAAVTLDSSGKVEQAALAVSAGRCAERVSDAEEALVGQAPTENLLGRAAAAAAAATDPVADIHADKEFRTHLVGVLVRRTLIQAIETARQETDD